MNLKMLNNESFADFAIRIINNSEEYGLTKQQAFKELFCKDMAKDNVRKIGYLSSYIQEAIDNGYDKKFLNNKNNKLNIKNNVLIIGDLHTPFVKKGYLDFCKKMYKKYNCNKVVFIGDILDNHYSSYHETIPDGHGAEKELLMAKKQISDFYREFPVADVCIGNHDRIPNRKSVSSGLSSHWIKDLKDVLCTESWNYSEYFIIDDVEYTHGTGRKAINRSKQDMISVVQGHYHSDSYINFSVGKNSKRTFAMQIGCGIQESEYAFAYGKDFAKPHINVGIVINGNLPIIEYMD